MSLRILITGGFGFVGGRLAVYLAQEGHQIVLGTRKAISPPVWLPQAKIAHIEWDNTEALELSCKSVDVVIQAAGMNSQNCAVDPAAALTFNGVATARLVAAASKEGVKRFIYLSTAHVYASPLVGTITEETCPRNLHPYATSHLAGEHAVLCANQRGQIQGIVLRLSNIFGAPMQKDVNCWMLLVNDLCRQAVQTRKLVLQSNGLQERDFIGMSDFCQISDFFLTGSDEMMQQGIFNVGSGTAQTVLTMAQLIQQRCNAILGFEPKLYRAQDKADIRQSTLIYRSQRLEKHGIHINGQNCALEIDRLLKFCQLTFTQIQSLSE